MWIRFSHFLPLFTSDASGKVVVTDKYGFSDGENDDRPVCSLEHWNEVRENAGAT
jgi:hypothetical protein